VPLIGARTRERLMESLGAADVELSDEHLDAIEAAVPKGAPAGERHDAVQMGMLDSERWGACPSLSRARAVTWTGGWRGESCPRRISESAR
jgi:hypothetical protein